MTILFIYFPNHNKKIFKSKIDPVQILKYGSYFQKVIQQIDQNK